MAKYGKRYAELLEKVEKKEYPLEEAVKKVKELKSAKFDETVECAVRLGVDPRKADQMVRGAVILPYGTGRKVRVLVITRGDQEKEAKGAGADYVGYKDLIEKIKGGWLDFDAVVATPDAMPDVAKLGRILGPRGLMPSPKTGTVTKNVAEVVNQLKKGRVEFRVDKTGNIHVPIGKISFPEEHLRENLLALLEELINLKPKTHKGTYVKSIHLAPTMGPSVEVSVSSVLNEIAKK